jgi:hypothetical protein
LVLPLFGRTVDTAQRAYQAFVDDGRRRVLSERVRGTVPGTWLDQPKPYVPGKRFASRRTRSATGRPTTLT